MIEKVGLGIITYNRIEFFKDCIDSVPSVDELVVVNDGNAYPESVYKKNSHIIQHKKNLGIAKTKNDAMKYLFNQNCKHIFIVEDDIIINEPNCLRYYIEASKITGIKHFNFAYVRENLLPNGSYALKRTVDYEGIKVGFWENLSGSFSYFHSDIIVKIGYIQTIYKNALEHVDYTYRISKHGFHPPFRWFADLINSKDFFIDQDPNSTKSLIQKSWNWKLRVYYNSFLFLLKNGYSPWYIPRADENDLKKYLSSISKNSFQLY